MAAPLFFCSNNLRRMYSVAPTSNPRVGSEATRIFGFRVNTRAKMSLCRLPPESVLDGASLLGVITLNSEISLSAYLSIAEWFKKTPFGKNKTARSEKSRRVSMTRFSLTERSMINPISIRSSGIRPTPASTISEGERLVISFPLTITFPPVALRMPAMTSASSLCPLPATPANPKISPSRTEREISLSASNFLSLKADTFLVSSAGLPNFAFGFFNLKITSRLTISRANSLLLVVEVFFVATNFPSLSTVTLSLIFITSSNL